MRGKAEERPLAGLRTTAGVLAGCGAALALAVVPAQAAGSDAAGTPAAGTVTTLAGGVGGPAPATLISFNSPYSCGSVQFANGHLYIADQDGDVVRSVNTHTDLLTTPAGNGQSGFTGDGVPATTTELQTPCAAILDGAGNLVVADKDNGRVRVVAAKTGAFYGQHMIAGDMYTVDNGGADCEVHTNSGSFCPVDVIADHNGNILVSNEGTEDPRSPSIAQVIAIPERSGTFYGKKMQAGKTYLLTNGGGFQIAVDHLGNILMAEGTKVTILAEKSGHFYGLNLKRGHTYVIAGTGKSGSSGDGGPARKATLNNASGLAVDQIGNIVIGDSNADHIRVVAFKNGTLYGKHLKAGDIYQLAGVRNGLTGSGVPAVKSQVGSPHSIAIDGQGNVVFCAGASPARVIAEKTGTFYGRHMKAGDVYTAAGNPNQVPYAGEGGPATSVQGASGGVAVDAAGSLLIANGRIRVVAASTATFYGKAMTKGHIYTIAGGGAGGLGDRGPATKARLTAADVAVDGSGNLVVTDHNNHRIRVVATRAGTFYGQPMTAGDIYTVAGDGAKGFAGDSGQATSAELNDPQGIAVDAAGNLVFVDTGSARIRVVAAATGTFYGQSMTAGDIYTIAGDGNCDDNGDGGPATSAEFCFINPDQLAVDAAGNLLVAAPEGGFIRAIAASTGTFYGQSMTAGNVYAVAGDGDTGHLGNGGPATSAGLHFPVGVAVDSHGNLIIGDSADEEVRVVAAASGTFYGVPMTAGDIYAVAGTGHFGLSGDDGPGLSAQVCLPSWVTVDHHGNLIFNDDCNGRIREIKS